MSLIRSLLCENMGLYFVSNSHLRGLQKNWEQCRYYSRWHWLQCSEWSHSDAVFVTGWWSVVGGTIFPHRMQVTTKIFNCTWTRYKVFISTPDSTALWYPSLSPNSPVFHPCENVPPSPNFCILIAFHVLYVSWLIFHPDLQGRTQSQIGWLKQAFPQVILRGGNLLKFPSKQADETKIMISGNPWRVCGRQF